MEEALSGGFTIQPPVKQTQSRPDDQFDELAKIIMRVKKDGHWEWVKQYWEERARHYEKEYAALVTDDVDYEKLGKAYAVAHLVAKEAEAFIRQVEITANDVQQRKSKRRR